MTGPDRRGFVPVPNAAVRLARSNEEMARVLDLWEMADRHDYAELDLSGRFLSERWECGKSTVERFLNRLIRAGLTEVSFPGNRLEPRRMRFWNPAEGRGTNAGTNAGTTRTTDKPADSRENGTGAGHPSGHPSGHVADQSNQTPSSDSRPQTPDLSNEQQLYEAWRLLGKGRRKSPSPARLKYLRARIKQDGLDTCLLVNEWAHKAPSGKWWRDHDATSIEALYKADKWDSRVEKAHAWKAGGKRTGDDTDAADHKQEAEKWFAALLGLASKGKKPNRVESMLAMLGHDGAPSPKSLAAWAALDSIGRCTDLGHATTFEVHALRKTFISTYTAARCNGSATSPVEAT